jgi:fucokinase
MSHWDILILTASNESQANTYRDALAGRCQLRNLDHVRHTLVVPDPEGKRIGSGGATIRVLAEAANLLIGEQSSKAAVSKDLSKIFAGKRILIIHAGGDSRRLPAYAPIGKVLVPLPGPQSSIEPLTLLDRVLQAYLELPAPADESGQIVIASGDVLPTFSAAALDLSGNLVGTAMPAAPTQAARHGVFCATNGEVSRFLQKPTPEVQAAEGAIDAHGNALLDIGLFSFDAVFAASLLDLAGYAPLKTKGTRGIGPGKTATPVAQAIAESGLDFYREIVCACGADLSYAFYLSQVRAAGSEVPDKTLELIFKCLPSAEFRVAIPDDCRFLHVGTSREILWSGAWLMRRGADPETRLITNSKITAPISGGPAWIEGCRTGAELSFGGDNLLVGVDSDKPLALEPGIALDLVPIADGLVLRVHGIHDSFTADSSFCNMPLADWLKSMAAKPADVWEKGEEQTLWNARVFPVIGEHAELHKWTWLQQAKKTKIRQGNWKKAPRVSAAELAELADREAYVARRRAIHREQLRTSQLPTIAAANSAFSAIDLGVWLAEDEDPVDVVRILLERAEACSNAAREGNGGAALEGARLLHSLASAAERLPEDHALAKSLAHDDFRSWAFDLVGEAVRAGSPLANAAKPEFALREDEIVWARSPARIDLAGGWTDTPPYTLENGGCVLNAAISLNGQLPIQVYLRRSKHPRIRLSSIDLGHRITIERIEDLMDFQNPASHFALVKAAIALIGFAPDQERWRGRPSLRRMLEQAGGGIEISTLCAIPKGSGLGTSSILGATILGALLRAFGREPEPGELCQLVLSLEQMLTTGGGWQDQVGGVLPGAKLAISPAGLTPNPQPSYIDPELICPSRNGGVTLLYYTGITRLAKNILQQVVGRVLDRDRGALHTLSAIRACADDMRSALSQKAPVRFGGLINEAWRLNNDLDPGSSNDEIEAIIERIRPHILGAKLAGAGGGGFLYIVCPDAESADKVRRELERHPPNERARFFEFAVSETGLEVTAC